jgi:molybdenum cofactor cytidylyltransferase
MHQPKAGPGKPLVGILLAAGASRRFGTDKLTAKLADGTCVVTAAARSLTAATPAVIAVVRSEDSAAAATLRRLGITLLVAPEAERGMGASLAAAVRHTPASSPGWLVALGDMPYVAPTCARQVARAITGPQDIALPVQDGRNGHPVAFGRAYRARLSNLDGDIGARKILHQFSDKIIPVPCPDPGIFNDIDHPWDLP